MSSISGSGGGDGGVGGDGDGGGGGRGDASRNRDVAEARTSATMTRSGGGDGGACGDRGRGGGGGASARRDPAQGTTSDPGNGIGAAGGGVGGGVGVGVGGEGEGGGGRDDPDPAVRHPHQAENTETVFPIEKRIEAYDGENEELDSMEAWLSVCEEPPSLQECLQDGPIVAANEVQVEQGGNQLGPNDLQDYLRQGEWNRALDILSQMVGEGRAAATTAMSHAHSRDITRAHLELVMLLRGQALFDLIGMGNAIRAHAYYRNYIDLIYPDGFITGIEFVDKLLVEIRAMVQRVVLPRNCRFRDKQKTRQCVNDYLKIYFSAFGDMETDGVVPVGIFGERQGNQVRCLVCHDFKKEKFSEKKLYYHQLCDPAGRQALCPASTDYIRRKIHDSLAKKEAATTAHPPLQDGAPGPAAAWHPPLQDGAPDRDTRCLFRMAQPPL